MRTFGPVRNIGNRLPEIGYAMASGTQQNVRSVQKDIADATAVRQRISDQISAVKRKLDDNTAQYTLASRKWKDCDSTDCKPIHSKNRCDSCRKPHQEKMNQLKSAQPSLLNELEELRAKLTAQRAVISGLEQELTTLLIAVEEEAAAETTLAGQGKTSSQIQIEAQAAAQAEVAKATAEAQKDIEATKSMSRIKTGIVITMVLAVVIVGAVYVVKRIKKGKESKK